MPPWPPGCSRIPEEPWTETSVKDLALDYDTVEQHGWYANLDPTVDALAEHVTDGELLVDYSGGTGILTERLLDTTDADVGVINVDSSRKFLRLALDKLGHDDRVAFRLIRYLDDRGRLEYVDEVLDDPLIDRGVDALVSTNAIHLYYDLPDTLAAWRRILRDDGAVFVQSGNIERDGRPSDRLIIDATVSAVDEAARRIVEADDAYKRHRDRLADEALMASYEELRDRYFLPARDLSYYLDRLRGAGFEIADVTHRPIRVDAEEWAEFLKVYHEGVLGWVGGTERVEDEAPDEDAVADREALIDRALDEILDVADGFEAEWTYIRCDPA